MEPDDLTANIHYANREFYGNDRGYSYNGLALVPMLKSLDVRTLSTTDTFEGYSVWEVVSHLAFYKHFFSSKVVKNFEPYPFPKGNDGFYCPAVKSESEWNRTFEYLDRIHRIAMNCVASISEQNAEEQIEEWGISWKETAVWLCAHDTYHSAQIRNMNVPGLKSKKLES